MLLDEAILGPIVTDIWATILDLELEPIDSESLPAETRVLTGCVQITGDWDGAVTLECSEALARRASAIMFGLDETDLSDEDLHDTVGELTNMTAGNVKATLAGSCSLSLPSVTSGPEHRVSIPGTRVLERLAFACGEHLLVACHLQRI
jgi:chemotaxis protein CheX